MRLSFGAGSSRLGIPSSTLEIAVAIQSQIPIFLRSFSQHRNMFDTFRAVLNSLFAPIFVSVPVPTASFDGQTVIMTGSNTGLGLEAARHITKLGAQRVILAVRSIAKGEAAKKSIEE